MKKLLKLYRMFYRLLRLKEYQRNAMLSRAQMVADMRLKHMRYAYNMIFDDYRSYKNLALEYGCNSASELKATIESLYKVKNPQKRNLTQPPDRAKEKKMDKENEQATGCCDRVAPLPRSASDVVCELGYERRTVAQMLAKLNKAIEADPEAVSAHHKELWRKQAKAMKEYVDVLGERIKDLIDNN